MLEETRQEAPKDRWGRYLVTTPDGKQRGYTRVTTIAKSCSEEGALKQWANRMVVTGLINRSDLLAQASTKLDDKSAMNKICEEAIVAGGGSSRANLGTALHALTEQIDLGKKPLILPGLQADLDAYTATLVKYGVHIMPNYIESVVIHDDKEYAGTLDRIVEVDGRMYIADLKTGTNLSYSWREIAIQLAAYADAEHIYDYQTAERTSLPMIEKDRAIVFHLPAGEARCELYWVDLNAGREGLQLALNVRAWRKRNDINQRFEDAKIIKLDTGLDKRRDWMTARIKHLPAPAQKMLRSLWPVDVPKLGEADNEQIDLLIRIVGLLEAEHSVQFYETDPAAKVGRKKAKK
jgi:hypothetical protein